MCRNWIEVDLTFHEKINFAVVIVKTVAPVTTMAFIHSQIWKDTAEKKKMHHYISQPLMITEYGKTSQTV